MEVSVWFILYTLRENDATFIIAFRDSFNYSTIYELFGTSSEIPRKKFFPGSTPEINSKFSLEICPGISFQIPPSFLLGFFQRFLQEFHQKILQKFFLGFLLEVLVGIFPGISLGIDSDIPL